ncbi:MAG: hypothetical protein AB7S26_32390 [Sandaracinaceae bacterium]
MPIPPELDVSGLADWGALKHAYGSAADIPELWRFGGRTPRARSSFARSREGSSSD